MHSLQSLIGLCVGVFVLAVFSSNFADEASLATVRSVKVV